MSNHDFQSTTGDAVSECLIDFAEMLWELPAPGVRVKQVCRDGQRLRLIEFSEEFVEGDWCRTGHVGYVIEGTLEIDFSGKLVRFLAGDALFIPAGGTWRHKARVPEDKAILFVVENLDPKQNAN